MTTSTLSIIILGFTVALFLTSHLARRAGAESGLWKITKALGVIVLGLVAYYFYLRFAG